MISRFVHQGFNAAQAGLYEFVQETAGLDGKSNFLSEIERELGVDPKHQITARIFAIPVALLDSALECLRPICEIIESAAVAILNFFGAIYYAAISDDKTAKRCLQMSLLNLNHAFETLLLLPLTILRVAIITIPQAMHILKDPSKSEPSMLSYSLFEAKDEDPHDAIATVEDACKMIQCKLFEGVRSCAGNPSQKSQTKSGSDKEAALEAVKEALSTKNELRYQEYLKASHGTHALQDNPSPIKSRLVAIPAVFLDAALEVITPIVTTITYLGCAIISFVAMFFVGAFDKEQALDLVRTIPACLTMAAYSLQHAITALFRVTITLIPNLITAIYEPREAYPCGFAMRQADSTQEGDVIFGFEKPIKIVDKKSAGESIGFITLSDKILVARQSKEHFINSVSSCTSV